MTRSLHLGFPSQWPRDIIVVATLVLGTYLAMRSGIFPPFVPLALLGAGSMGWATLQFPLGSRIVASENTLEIRSPTLRGCKLERFAYDALDKLEVGGSGELQIFLKDGTTKRYGPWSLFSRVRLRPFLDELRGRLAAPNRNVH